MRRRSIMMRATTAVMLAATVGVVGDATPVAAGPAQITAWNHTYTATSTSYFTPPPAGWGLPTSLISPDNYRDGNAYLRVQISGKPSDLPTDLQTCFWRHSSTTNYFYETCSSMRRITTDGDYYIELGAIGDWWQKNSNFGWGSLPSVTRIMLKDAETQKLLMSRSCGGACWLPSRGDLETHVPITMTGQLILVRAGASLNPPSSWRNGCPTSWSTACGGNGSVPGPGGGNVPVTDPPPPTTPPPTTPPPTTPPPTTPPPTTPPPTTPPPTTPPPTTPPPTTPPPTTPPPTTPPDAAGAVVVVSGTPTGTSGDEPIRSRLSGAGHTVVIVDDDALTSAALAGAEAIVLTSSVVPSKIPTWLRTTPHPMLVSEAYAIEPLGLGSGRGETTGQTVITIRSAHPITAGLTGTTSVASATTFGWATAAESADVVASLTTDASRATIFAIETGDTLTGGGVAPARRVGYYLTYPAAEKTNESGWTVFDQAIDWLTSDPGSGGSTPVDPPGGGSDSPPVSPLVPARLLESRSGPDFTTIDRRFQGTGRTAAGGTTTLKVTGRGGVPTNATAVFLNVAAVAPSAPGYLTVYPCGTTRPLAANVNYDRGGVAANAVLAKIGTNGNICIYTRAETDLVIDTNGYVPAGASVSPLVPARLSESRSGPDFTTIDRRFEGTGRTAAGGTTTLKVTGRGGVPTNATAVFLNVAAVAPSAPGYLTVYPCGTTRPLAANVNYDRGGVAANAVLAKIGTNGNICIYTRAETDLVIDTNGYVPAGASVSPLVPARLSESRSGPDFTTIDRRFEGTGRTAAGGTTTLKVTGRGGVPTNATAVFLNVAAVAPSAPGYLTVYPCGTTRPLAANVNYDRGGVAANAVLAKIGTNGNICIYTRAETDLVIDTNGYVTG